MRCAVICFCLVVSLFPAIVLPQTKSQRVKRENNSSTGSIRICQGVPIPDGYVIVAYETNAKCPHGAYLLKKETAQSRFVAAGTQAAAPESEAAQPAFAPPAVGTTAASRPRKVNVTVAEAGPPQLIGVTKTPAGPPTLRTTEPLTAIEAAPAKELSPTTDKTGEEEVGEGDVVRIDTNLVTVPVSVLDRDGRFISNLQRQQFTVFENGVEQKIAYFEPTEKPFTVALVLDTSGSTVFKLWEIKEAAIGFAKQLRPQDRVLVVTFDDQVMLLTEATNDLNIVTEVIQRNARTGFSTRLYDAVDLVIKERLNKIPGRKAIVLFTDGVDTSSFQATYQSTLREAEELDALIYPIQYDTTDYMAAMNRPSNVTIVTTQTGGNWPFPGRSSSRTIYSSPTSVQGPGPADYKKADEYLHLLAYKTGARLYQANDRTQLTNAFSKIAEELRCQYSLGYYPQGTSQSGERRQIRVHVDRPNLAVRARDSYTQKN